MRFSAELLTKILKFIFSSMPISCGEIRRSRVSFDLRMRGSSFRSFCCCLSSTGDEGQIVWLYGDLPSDPDLLRLPPPPPYLTFFPDVQNELSFQLAVFSGCLVSCRPFKIFPHFLIHKKIEQFFNLFCDIRNENFK